MAAEVEAAAAAAAEEDGAAMDGSGASRGLIGGHRASATHTHTRSHSHRRAQTHAMLPFGAPGALCLSCAVVG